VGSSVAEKTDELTAFLALDNPLVFFILDFYYVAAIWTNAPSLIRVVLNAVQKYKFFKFFERGDVDVFLHYLPVQKLAAMRANHVLNLPNHYLFGEVLLQAGNANIM